MTDTKERKPVAWQRRLSGPSVRATAKEWHVISDEQRKQLEKDGHPHGLPDVTAEIRPLYSADALERLERERDEALANLGATARLALSLEVEADERIAVAESELTTLRTRVAKMEEALKEFGFGGDAAQERIGWRGVYPVPSTNAHFRCEFCMEEHEDSGKIQHQETCPISIARAALTEEQP